MQYVWIRRGYGCFVRCKNVKKAKEKAEHWNEFGHGDKGGENGEYHNVIGMFVGKVNSVRWTERTELFNTKGKRVYKYV